MLEFEGRKRRAGLIVVVILPLTELGVDEKMGESEGFPMLLLPLSLLPENGIPKWIRINFLEPLLFSLTS
ncbi:unnamed protein product [Gongylonema pulchrum]|uniref:Uncharacterized protein n=1 Tax=Gongylonema pulchrum TaxID=637853 RepID=A0A183D0I7_9BILA|nr:unnamed protein product [Gongylonema pulchrum]